ncbi:hypothetical protein [Bacillus sp. AFS041924]|uniref:hypothetical protein n=1 Tax=Bacillus sp. AFS041924 TaxID=2033503 RepID=UPI000BFB71AF|nr:hypothetical protein [Bacillus sp. AFS041924]PGS50153.1 hypothetical protein COC46_13515 [Bacillus sp. AFS041924]
MKAFITLLEIINVVCVVCILVSNFGVEWLKEIKMFLYTSVGLSFVLSYFLKKKLKSNIKSTP